MQNGLYVALSAQVALEQRLETIADNVANMNTVGYRATGVSFESEMARAGDARLSYASSGSNFISRRLGGLIKTDNSLDFAVQGDGWFGIQTPQGTAYTRDGRTTIDESGTLRTLNGDPILDAGGAPILLDAGGGPVSVSADGMITQNGRQVGAIGLFAIDPTASLKRAENSSVVPDKPATPILEFTRDGVVQGAVESSNVDPVREMTRLIEVTRAFDGVAAETSQSESSLQDAIKALGSSGMTDACSDVLPLERLEHKVTRGLRDLPITRAGGRVIEVSTSHYRVAGLSRFLKLGECVSVDTGDRMQIGEVVRIDDGSATLKPFDARSDAAIGARAFRTEALSLSPHRAWKGRVVDALGRPIDGAGELPCGERPAPLDASPPPPLKRGRVHAPLRTGVRVVDLFTPLCIGQRVGVFAGSGVGKSSLLAMLARATPIDTVVIALVGERGREVREFLDDTLGDNRSSAVAVVSTGDESPMMRRLAPKTAMAIAEYFRDMGESVLADRRFGHSFRACRARCGPGGGRAGGRPRLRAKRLQRPAAAARARRAGR